MLTDKIGNEHEYVLVRLIVLCSCDRIMCRRSRLAVDRSAIHAAAACVIPVRTRQFRLIYNVLHHPRESAAAC